MRSALVPILLNSAPGWVLPGASLDMDYANARAWVRGRGYSAITDLLTTTRASTGYGQTVAGALTSFLANTSRVTDLGDTIEAARTNLALQSQTYTNAAWQKNAAFTMTGAFAVAPDGTTTASRLVYAGGAGTPDSRGVTQININPPGGTANKTITVAVWLKSNTGASQAARIKNTHGGVVDTFSAVTVTTTWQRFTFTVVNDASAGDGTQIPGVYAAVADTALDLLVWNSQLEVAATASSDIITTTVTVTRAADSAVVALGNVTRIVFKFSDGTTQTVSGVTPNANYTIPTNLNKPIISRMTGYPT